ERRELDHGRAGGGLVARVEQGLGEERARGGRADRVAARHLLVAHGGGAGEGVGEPARDEVEARPPQAHREGLARGAGPPGQRARAGEGGARVLERAGALEERGAAARVGERARGLALLAQELPGLAMQVRRGPERAVLLELAREPGQRAGL